MATKKQDLVLEQGRTFTQVIRWSKPPIVYKPVTAITQTAPVSITSTGHGVPDGWKVAVVSAKGMTQINASTPPKDKEYRIATVVDVNTLQLNEVNAAGYSAYTSGGYVQYDTPVDMAGYTARMSIKDKVGGTELLRLTTENNRIVIDNNAKTITLTISATDTAGITFKKGVYDLEMVSSGGVVTALLTGNVSVTQEVTST
jgi:hypothetical protein